MRLQSLTDSLPTTPHSSLVQLRATVRLQAFGRYILAHNRSMNKRILDSSSLSSYEAVDTRSLFVGDVKDLVKRISAALKDSEHTPYPPDEVLHLLRLVCMVVQGAYEQTGT